MRAGVQAFEEATRKAVVSSPEELSLFAAKLDAEINCDVVFDTLQKTYDMTTKLDEACEEDFVCVCLVQKNGDNLVDYAYTFTRSNNEDKVHVRDYNDERKPTYISEVSPGKTTDEVIDAFIKSNVSEFLETYKFYKKNAPPLPPPPKPAAATTTTSRKRLKQVSDVE